MLCLTLLCVTRADRLTHTPEAEPQLTRARTPAPARTRPDLLAYFSLLSLAVVLLQALPHPNPNPYP